MDCHGLPRSQANPDGLVQVVGVNVNASTKKCTQLWSGTESLTQKEKEGVSQPTLFLNGRQWAAFLNCASESAQPVAIATDALGRLE